jgi:5-methylcytosine-specific restriction endonuclease McrA
MVYLLLSARTESRGAFLFYGLHDSQNLFVGKAPALSVTRAVLADVQANDDVGVLRFMTKKDGKPCKKCGGNEWGKDSKCVPCERERKSRWRQANPDKERESKRRYRETNPIKVQESQSRFRESHPDKVKEYKTRWKKSNPEKVQASSRRHYWANLDTVRERNSHWHKKNPEKAVAKTNRRRTRKTAAGGSFTAAEWNDLIERYGGKCLCCGRADIKLTADHVVPVSKGGTSNIENIQPLCKSCNSRKKDKAVDYRPAPGIGRWIQRKLLG